MHFAFLQILLGALVAGIDAGRTFNDWPLMAGEVLPPEAFDLAPLWRNFFENAGLVQFMHRVSGYLLFVFGIVVWLRARPFGKWRDAVRLQRGDGDDAGADGRSGSSRCFTSRRWRWRSCTSSEPWCCSC